MEETVDVREVEHTADWALRVRGQDLGALFTNAAVGLARLMVEELATIPLEVERSITVEALDVESLLVAWLEELAFLAEMESLVFPRVDVSSITPERLVAKVVGGRSAFLQKHIKAVTYHNLEVVQTESGYEATLVFDV
jgi:SHS2 domain-containing protein